MNNEKISFGYGKPSIIPAEAPENASEQLKKTGRSMKTYLRYLMLLSRIPTILPIR